MADSSYKHLLQMSEILPSGGRVSVDNEHDVPNLVGMFVDMFTKGSVVSCDEVADVVRSKGWSEENVAVIANIADIVGLTILKIQMKAKE